MPTLRLSEGDRATNTRRATATNDRTLRSCLIRKAEINTMLVRRQTLSAGHILSELGPIYLCALRSFESVGADLR